MFESNSAELEKKLFCFDVRAVYGVYGVGGGRENSENPLDCWVKGVGGTTGERGPERAPGYIV